VIHRQTTVPGNFWGVSKSTLNKAVLVQLQEKGEQVRISLTPDEAERMAKALLEEVANLRSVE